MKKQLVILSALTVLSSPLALANQSEISTTSLPSASDQELIIDISGTEIDTPSTAVKTSIESAIEEANSNFIRTYQYIEHVDLRDVLDEKHRYEFWDRKKKIRNPYYDPSKAYGFDKELAKLLPDDSDRLPGTSRKILDAISKNPFRFAGADVRYYEDGARGPGGSSTFIQERGRNEFVINKRYPETQTNTIFSADYISAVEVAPSVIEAKLLLFIHSDNIGHYFRKLTVRVDWKKNKTHSLEDVVSVLKVDDEILLKDTDFKMKGSLSAQKIILEDQNSGIVKVFPVTVGAIDARTNSVESMTFWVPEKQRRAGKTEALQREFQDFSNAALVKRSHWSTGFNTSERLYPSYYSGRPFIALIDMNYVSSETNFGAGYREIGLHYQITEPNLERGFKSHGCVRVIDKDLYQLDAIVNHGPKNTIASIFKKRLPEYEDINHPHTYKSTYSKVGYTDYRSEIQSGSVACKYKGNDSYQYRSVRWNSKDENEKYHTIIDSDCLTKVYKTDNTANEVRNFWAQVPGSYVDSHIVYTEHSPVSIAREALISQNYYMANIEAMDHKTRLKTVYDLKQGSIVGFGNAFNTGIDYNTPLWPNHGIINRINSNQYYRIRSKIQSRTTITRREAKNYYAYLYVNYCSSPINLKAHSNCGEFELNALKYR